MVVVVNALTIPTKIKGLPELNLSDEETNEL